MLEKNVHNFLSAGQSGNTNSGVQHFLLCWCTGVIVHHFKCLFVSSFVIHEPETHNTWGHGYAFFSSLIIWSYVLNSVEPASLSKHTFHNVETRTYGFHQSSMSFSHSVYLFLFGLVPISTHFLCRNLQWKNKYT